MQQFNIYTYFVIGVMPVNKFLSNLDISNFSDSKIMKLNLLVFVANLISAHAAFVILHNNIADELKRVNPGWTEEKIFQETKKIVSAIQSNIHYYEWLPIVVGRTMINRYRLGGYSGHDSNTNPSVL